MFSCLQLLISWTNLPWLVEKGEKSAGWLADRSGGREVLWCRVEDGLNWNVSWAKVCGWAQRTPLDKINQYSSTCFCHCHTFFSIGATFHQYDRTPDRNWAILSGPDISVANNRSITNFLCTACPDWWRVIQVVGEWLQIQGSCLFRAWRAPQGFMVILVQYYGHHPYRLPCWRQDWFLPQCIFPEVSSLSVL